MAFAAELPARAERTDWLADFPRCGEPLKFVRKVPQMGDLSDLQTFECVACRLSITSETVLDQSLGGVEQSGRWLALEPFLTLYYRGPVGDEGLDPQCGLHR